MTTTPESLEPFGPTYLQPAQEECPNCLCCSAVLCRRGRASVMECAGCTSAESRATVAGCPCSAATTEGTASWRAGMVTAVLQAVELPLPEPMEALLRRLAAGEPVVEDPHGFLVALRLRQFVQTREDVLAVTDLGRAYLTARDGGRRRVQARVTHVDEDDNTARIMLDVCRPDSGVTVLLEQLTAVTGVESYELPGLDLDVVANVDAERAEDIVLTGVRTLAKRLPPEWQHAGTAAAPEGDDGD